MGLLGGAKGSLEVSYNRTSVLTSFPASAPPTLLLSLPMVLCVLALCRGLSHVRYWPLEDSSSAGWGSHVGLETCLLRLREGQAHSHNSGGGSAQMPVMENLRNADY